MRLHGILDFVGSTSDIKVSIPSQKQYHHHQTSIVHHQLDTSATTSTLSTISIKMKTPASIAALIATASAQYYNVSSAGFQLVLDSHDGTINDTVSACHTGAALESLCLSNSNTTSKPNPTPYDTFYFNTTSNPYVPVNHTELGAQGILTWFLPVSNYGPVPSSVYFDYDPSTNSATPILTTGSSQPQILAFNEFDELLVQSYVDWTADPPKYDGPVGLQRWYACKTYYAGYQYENLVWGLGIAAPDNPTCVAVTVTRKFV
jgi:hypothetical protein